ncbi:cytidylyltransferase domain-containing protein [Lewinella sp. IMCC34191]|uniref:acylneuraminate cytidylyltransferase family protein n=1 Tax=Lewinella sp. IMCC34191 TaxID=2259172 RepID=UPI000E2834C5|nr:NTP transferase domain-containing protein [Lewinella sp. IMCC34191]
MVKGLKAIIPVREGSTRIKEKVLLPLGGKTLLGWKIQQLQEIMPSEDIYVSTNSDRLIEIATDMGVSYHRRSDRLSEGVQTTFSEVITGIVSEIEADHVAWITVVVPLMRPNQYRDAFEKYEEVVVEHKRNDSLVTVNKLKEYFWTDEGAFNYEASKNHTISQNLKPLYRVTNGLYMAPKEIVMQEEYFLGTNPHLFEVPKIAGVDIDEIEDYNMSKYLLNMYFDEEFAGR